MKPSIIHSIAVCLTAFALPFMVACNSQEESLTDTTEAALYLNIEPIVQSRAGVAELPDNEKMKSVRVVVLHADGTVEHNRDFSLEDAQAQKTILLKVTPDEKKRIFLFANEESVSAVEGVTGENQTLTDFFESYTDGDSGFEDAVNGLYFAPDYSGGKPIPMSSMYEIDFPAKGNFDGTFYVVRVATKFMVNFINWRGEDVIVDRFTIASHADKNFLMAHVGDSEQNRLLFNGKTWINWLKEVSDASSENDDYATTEAAGWLKDYELPTQVKAETYTHGTVIVGKQTIDTENPANSKPGVAENVPVFYLPESKNTKAGATDGEQEYTMTIYINGRSEPFVCKLPNLKALFRNTHVVVNITMYHNLDLSVDVIPFTPIDLKPDYGLQREEFTGYIAGKDDQDRKHWYDGTAGPYYLGPKDKEGEFVTINGKEYLLVYADYERTAAKLDHFFEKETRKKYLLTPEGITGYKPVMDGANPWLAFYLNDLHQRVWLDDDYMKWDVVWNPDFKNDKGEVVGRYEWVYTVGKWYRTFNEWNRLDWNRAVYDKEVADPRIYPKYWFDILGNRYTWSEGDTKEKRADILKEWTQYLE